tara:strand:- start:588 stop:2819 length:2232 start_codon:yes stop_codon:yes gene_type:complete
MPTFSENIQRMKAASSANSQFRVNESAEIAKIEGQDARERARLVATSLSSFSRSLQEWKQEDIKIKEQEGKEEFIKAEEEKAAMLDEKSKKILELQKQKADAKVKNELDSAKAIDLEIEKLKAEMLKANGPDIFPDADRLSKLSPHQQVGFVKEKLRLFKESYPDKLAHQMANSEKAMRMSNVEFTMKQINENNLALPLKEYGARELSKDIKKAAGIHKFSPEMLRLAGVNEAIEKAHTAQMSKHRERYNIESSQQTQGQNKLFWQQSDKTGKDIEHFLVREGNTVNGKNVILHRAGAWKSFDNMIVQEAVNGKGLDYIDEVLNQPMPDSMCKDLGVPLGTPFSKQWKNKIATLRAQAKKLIVQGANDERDWLQSQQTILANNFDKLRQKGDISTDQLNAFKDQSRYLGGVLDARIKNYETVSMRDERVDKQRIKDLMASNNGYITHDMLNEFHPRAALEFRKDADRHEAALKKEHNVEGLIKAGLNQSWTDAGIKNKEKSVVWEFAKNQALKDYETKFNQLVSWGYDADTAAHLALNALPKEVINKDTGEVVPGFEGVLSEIKRNGAASKYTQIGEKFKASLEEAHLRQNAVRQGKIEMLETDGKIINDGIIGGEYGQDRINEILQSIKIHGTWKGIRKAEKALKYYEGLALGKRQTTAYGLIDAQLRASGHPGLFPKRVIVEDTDETGLVDAETNALSETNYPGSIINYTEVLNNLDENRLWFGGGSSIWNTSEELAPYAN